MSATDDITATRALLVHLSVVIIELQAAERALERDSAVHAADRRATLVIVKQLRERAQALSDELSALSLEELRN